MKLSDTKDGLVLNVFVKPNSQKFEVQIEDEEVVIRCTEEPMKGKVNKEIIKEISKLFHSRVEIVSGKTIRKKVLLLRDVNKSEMEKILSSF